MASMTREALVEQLRAAFGSALRAVVQYGSTEAGEHFGRTGHDILVITERLGLEELAREGAITRAWSEAGHPPPLTFTVAEWVSSSDIFPMEYADILERHRVLYGSLPLDGVKVDRDNLRIQTEHEAMGKLLRLRRGVLAAGNDRKRILELLANSLSTFMVIFRAVLRLHGESPPTDYETLARRVGTLAGLDAEPFQRVVRHQRGSGRIPEAEANTVLAGYLAGAERLVAHLDQGAL
jgi:hypothetical protein